jgi:dTDP-4-amino-4,6-dideoxygalactose transaminase
MIPVLDLKAQYRSIEREISGALNEVLASTDFVLGPQVKKLEQELARYCECRHAVGVASGTDALRLAMAALGIGPGDEVITSPFSFIATANTISHCGAKPVFVDIDPETFNISPTQVEGAVTLRTRAIVPVHLYGQPADLRPMMALAEKEGLHLIEDCAQAIGARYQGRPVGSLGNAGCLSFYPTKNLGAYGDGGMVLTNDPFVAEKIDVLRRQGSRKKYHAEVLGFNSRLDSLQAAVLGVKLKYLDAWNEARRKAAHKYNQLLSELPVKTPMVSEQAWHVYHQYTIRTPRRDELAEHLKRRGIGTMVYYPIPIHQQAVYASAGETPSLPHAEAAAKEVLSLPIYPEITDGQVETVASAIRDFFHGGNGSSAY